MNTLANNIKELRRRAGMTQEALAQTLHVTRQAISNWENGKNQPDLDMLSALAAALDTDIGQLINAASPPAYPRFQRRYLIRTATCILLLLLVILCGLMFYPTAREIQMRNYNPFYLLILGLVAYPSASCAFGAFLPWLLALWLDIHLPKTARKVLFILSLSLLLPVLLLFICLLSQLFTDAFRWLYRLYYPLLRFNLGRMFTIIFLPFLSGIFLALSRP